MITKGRGRRERFGNGGRSGVSISDLASLILARPIRLGVIRPPWLRPLPDFGREQSECEAAQVEITNGFSKFELLRFKAARAVKLSRESSTTVYRFPVSSGELEFAANLLDVRLKFSSPKE